MRTSIDEMIAPLPNIKPNSLIMPLDDMNPRIRHDMAKMQAGVMIEAEVFRIASLAASFPDSDIRFLM